MIMGEKRAYKPRKPGGGRKKLKPEYDAGENLKEQLSDPAFRQTLKEEYAAFWTAYQQDRDLLLKRRFFR